jgi:hypothetical protein
MWRVRPVGEEADADGMRAALAAHEEVLRSAIETYGGYLFSHTVLTTAVAQPRTRYMQIASRNQFGSPR